ncbi:unnamed protein product, partial [marine sediment metagenome]
MIDMRKNTDAVSSVVSALFAVLIVTSVSGTVLLWGLPYMDSHKADASIETVFNQLNVAVDVTSEMIRETSGSARQYEFNTHGGYVSIDSTGDRFIVMYCLDPNYNFTVTGLENNDNEFYVTFSDTPALPTNISATVYWFDDQASDIQSHAPGDGDVINYTTVKFE